MGALFAACAASRRDDPTIGQGISRPVLAANRSTRPGAAVGEGDQDMTETVREQSAAVTISRGMWVVAGAAMAAALVMVFLGFERPGAGAQAADPYRYGEIARGLLEHGFDRVTRR